MGKKLKHRRVGKALTSILNSLRDRFDKNPPSQEKLKLADSKKFKGRETVKKRLAGRKPRKKLTEAEAKNRVFTRIRIDKDRIGRQGIAAMKLKGWTRE